MSEEIKCCLCFRCLTDSTSRKKRKRLDSDMCSHSKQVLEQLLHSTRNATLSNFVETKGSDAYLCYQCDGKAHGPFLTPCLSGTVKHCVHVLIQPYQSYDLYTRHDSKLVTSVRCGSHLIITHQSRGALLNSFYTVSSPDPFHRGRLY